MSRHDGLRDKATGSAASTVARPSGYEAAFGVLEGPINRAEQFAATLRLIAEAREEGGTDEFIKNTDSAIYFLAQETFAAIGAVQELWLSRHNSCVDRGA